MDDANRPPFERWMQESGIWQGDDYLWVNRYRDLWQAYRTVLYERDEARAEVQRLNKVIAYGVTR